MSSAILLTIAPTHLSSITFLCLLVSTCFVLLMDDKASSPLYAINSYLLYLQQPRGVVESKPTLNDRSVLDVVSTPFLEPTYLVLRYVPFEDGWPQEPHLSK